MTAKALLDRIRSRGGRVYRMTAPPNVLVLTNSEELVHGLEKLGAKVANEYHRERGGTKEWDLWIVGIPVEGEQSIWEAAAR